MRNSSIYLTFVTLLFIGVFSVNAQSNSDDIKSINTLITKKRAYNKTVGYGFKIQLYNGTEKRAKSLRGRFNVKFPHIHSNLKYDAPEWKVHVGNYKTRLEADKALNKIQEKFTGAIVITL
ncbi:SPOR domain-containing protein [Tenacibaculum sp.]|nr:SPOR domain-containing protein [Tenacibaculum sp.]